MRLIATYDSAAIAYIDKGYLQAHDVPAFVEQNAMSEVFPAPDAGTSAIGLYVDDDNYQKAKALLASRPE